MKTGSRTRRAILFVSILMMSTVALAQRNQGPPPAPNDQQITQMVRELASELSLSESQATRIKDLYQSHFEEMSETMTQQKRPGRRAMDAARKRLESNVKAVLTPDQAQAYDEFLKNNEPQPDSRRPRR